MKIQVLGSGCPTCKKLFELTSKAVKEVISGVNTQGDSCLNCSCDSKC